MKKFALTIVAFMSCLFVNAQRSVKPLKVGDKCPDFVFTKISNSNKSSVRLSDLQGKLVILDFGGLGGCPPCIKGAIELDSLMRNEFRDKMVSIYCMSKHAWGENGPPLLERKKSVEQYLKQNKVGRSLHQIVDWGDTLLSNYFPHTFYPHLVWISKDGKILAITNQDYLNSANIRQALSGKNLGWEIEYQEANGLDLNQPFVVYNQSNTPYVNGDSSVKYYSSFLNYLPGIGRYISSYFANKNNKIEKGKKRVAMINVPIVEMYLELLRPDDGKDIVLNNISRIIYEVKDRSRYDIYDGKRGRLKLYTKELEWRKKNLYGYDGIFPEHLSQDEITKRVVDEFNYSLGLNGRVEKRNTISWVLNSNLNYSKKFENRPLTEDSLYSPKRMQGLISITNLLWELSHREGALPFVDESHLTKENMDAMYVKISPAALQNRELLNDQLQPYGLSVIQGERELEMLVITENGYKPLDR